MNKNDYLLICINEEATEIIEEIIGLVDSKHQMFSTVNGFSSYFLDTPKFKDFVTENNDMIGCIKLVTDSGIVTFDDNHEEIIKERCNALRSKENLDLLDMVKDILHIQYTVSKLLRFGLDHTHPVFKTKGRANLKEALYNYLAWVWLFMEEFANIENHHFFDTNEIHAKIAKVCKYMKIATQERIITER